MDTPPEMPIRSTVNTLLVFGLMLVILNVLTARFVITGDSMNPGFEEGQYLLINRMSYSSSIPQRGDVIVFHLRREPETELLKRVVGIPGDTLEFRDSLVYINGSILAEPYIAEPCSVDLCSDGLWQLGQDEYFVMGDNRNYSRDSRYFGTIGVETIVGEAILRYVPLFNLTRVNQIGIEHD